MCPRRGGPAAHGTRRCVGVSTRRGGRGSQCPGPARAESKGFPAAAVPRGPSLADSRQPARGGSAARKGGEGRAGRPSVVPWRRVGRPLRNATASERRTNEPGRRGRRQGPAVAPVPPVPGPTVRGRVRVLRAGGGRRTPRLRQLPAPGNRARRVLGPGRRRNSGRMRRGRRSDAVRRAVQGLRRRHRTAVAPAGVGGGGRLVRVGPQGAEYRERLAHHGRMWDERGLDCFASTEVPWAG